MGGLNARDRLNRDMANHCDCPHPHFRLLGGWSGVVTGPAVQCQRCHRSVHHTNPARIEWLAQ